jgi:AraC-like DNA-binding protein
MVKSLQKSATPLLRMGHVMAITTPLREAGALIDRHLRSQKLPVLCNDPDLYVPLKNAWSFFAHLARHEDPMIGWHAGAHAGDRSLGRAITSRLLTAPTLLVALRRFVHYSSAEASHIMLGIHERREDILFCTRYPGRQGAAGYHVAQAYQLEVILQLIRRFLGRHWMPDEIGIEHHCSPDAASEQFPGARILTGQPAGYIAVPRSFLDRAASHRSGGMNFVPEPTLTQNFCFADILRQLLRAYMPDGYPSARLAASLVGVSERTMARRLSGRGLTYGSLVDEVRFTEARQLLLHSDLRIEDVAVAVGFTNQGNFTRMFRRIGGLTPTEYRKATLH